MLSLSKLYHTDLLLYGSNDYGIQFVCKQLIQPTEITNNIII